MPDRIEPYVWKIAGVVILGMTMSILDTTIVNVALDTLGRELHTTLAQIQWVATGYLLALAAVIPLTGWAARRFGAKRVYLASIFLFTLGSALCGFWVDRLCLAENFQCRRKMPGRDLLPGLVQNTSSPI